MVINMVGFKSLGETVIVHTLSCAYLILSREYTYKSKNYIIGSEALASIIREDIHEIIDRFGLGLDGDFIVNSFFYLARSSNNEKNKTRTGDTNGEGRKECALETQSSGIINTQLHPV